MQHSRVRRPLKLSPSADTLLEATMGSRFRIAAWSFGLTELQYHPHGFICLKPFRVTSKLPGQDFHLLENHGIVAHQR